eukprot:CAMPEP_0197463012 /NCGR_PEP_ID=MMETSP1175-20131217/60694_1 /TAXON_ID=1003142 /ORGANISM="Triceratium dubium, Strain CCMP147" /LENGTH=69 /DNA_ID=CAMNT_0042998675 /DNA_START=572 /DNA_END=781 /DNA_ORIENTATION=-
MDNYKSRLGDQLVTVWSAPNYCHQCGDVAYVVEMDECANRSFATLNAAPWHGEQMPSTVKSQDTPDYLL